MSVTVRFFASTRERVGRDVVVIELEAPVTVAEVWLRAVGSPPPPRLLAAVNMEYADFSQPVRDGDEVGFFPPVSGGGCR